MTPLHINRAIAEACGWVEVHSLIGNRSTLYGWHPEKHPREKHYYETLIPRYTNDLNAMHEAVDSLPEDKKAEYHSIVHRVVGIENARNPGSPRFATEATAAQRAEAFLRTIGEWEEAE